MNQSDLLLMAAIVSWLLIGAIMLRTVYKQVHMSMIIVKFMGYKKTVNTMELLIVLLWPIAWLTVIPISAILYRRVAKEAAKKT